MFVAALDVILAGLLGFYVYEFAIGYKEAKGTTWQRVLAGAKGSATILWARFVQAVTASVTLLVSLADLLNAPQVGQAIQQYAKPQYVAAIFVGIAIITEIARRRPGSGNPTS